MKESIQEYHPNGRLKYSLLFHNNGNKWFEYYYNEEGRYHNDSGPYYQRWYENGFLYVKTFVIHDYLHNDSGPASIWLLSNGKIWEKMYYLKNRFTNYTKLAWMNQIKNIR